MVLVRLAYVADLPTPAELVRSLDGSRAPATDRPRPRRPPARAGGVEPPAAAAPDRQRGAPPRSRPAPCGDAARPAEPETAPTAPPARSVGARADAAELRRGRGAVRPAARGGAPRASVRASVISSHFEPGRIEFRPAEGAPRDLANRLGQLLGEWTGDALARRVSRGRGRADLARSRRKRRERDLRNEVASHPLVQAVLEPSRRDDRGGPRALCRRDRRAGRGAEQPTRTTTQASEEDEL